MALTVWTERSGYRFSTIQERTIIDQSLPVYYANGFADSTNLSFNVISGTLPPGLRLVEDHIKGSAFEVPRTTDFRFVIRAQYGDLIADRTFFMTVEGSDVPTWQTPAGSMAIKNEGQYYVLDSTYIDFQLDVIDYDTAAGQTLKFFKSAGQLPPGLILTESGRIVGWIQPALGIPETAGNGSWDTTLYDAVAYDFGSRSSNGYDSYIFDSVIFDYAQPTLTPKKLNRYYEFTVIVTDGDTEVSRTFKIYVVGDDYFKADNIAIYVSTGVFTVDTTYVRPPIWVTPNDLGIRRANNYQTFKLDTYTGIDLGPIVYEFDAVNPKVYGKAYTTLSTENKIGRSLLRIKEATATPTVGQKITLKNYVEGASSQVYTVNAITVVSSTEFVLTVSPNLLIGIVNNTQVALGTTSQLPPGMLFDPGSAEVFGTIPYQPATTESYEFTIIASRLSDRLEIARSRRTFSVQVIGEIDSVITWTTDSDLGELEANLVSTLSVKATTTLANAVILYTVTSGSLPPGLTLNLDGEIVGKVRQFGSVALPGLITIDESDLILDGGDTTLDRDYSFTVQAKDVTNYSTITREFSLYITTPNDRLYSNLVVRPFLKQNQRSLFRSFITDSSIFNIESIYRPSDSNFGIQTDLKMLVFAGIETKSASEVVSKINRNHKTKKFIFGDLKKAVAKIPGTNTVIYEVIYLEMLDPLESNGKYLPATILTSPTMPPITVDQNDEYNQGPFNVDSQYWGPANPLFASIDRNDIFVGDPNSQFKFVSSITNWRLRIEEIGLKDRNYLPLWMRSIQNGQVQELDYVPAVPLCYCKPGMADDIVLNIKNRDFDFTQIDYVIDRYIIDSVTGYSADKYIVFRNDRTTIS